MTAAHCPICEAAETPLLLRVDDLPVHSHLLCASPSEARAVARGDIELRQCVRCGHGFNAAFDPSRLHYHGHYENSLEHSPLFREYADRLAADLIQRWNVRGQEVLEAACGNGAFLRRLCDLGGNHGTGYDPAFRGPSPGTDPSLHIRAEPFTDKKVIARADLLCCRQGLEHMDRPVAFLSMLRRAARPHGHLFIEVPNGLLTLDGAAPWDLLYEHGSYFTSHSLRFAATAAGLNLEEVVPAYGDQYLCLYAGVSGDEANRNTEAAPVSPAANLADRLAPLTRQWKSRLERWQVEGESVVLWGAGTKAITFLNMLQPGAAVAAVVDINPEKQGRFIPGTGHPIIGPSALTGHPPDRVLVMNPLYQPEIRATMQSIKPGCRIECV